MSFSPLTKRLIQALQCLPGVGPKSAQRMALHLLERNRPGGNQLAQLLSLAMENVKNCTECRTFSENLICDLCSHPARDPSLLCVVETPADVIALEQTASYKGLYFVLMGHLSPIDGIGPKDIGIDAFNRILKERMLQEIILATNPTVEGEATAYYLAEVARDYDVKASRIAHGVPLGSELEHIDGGTLSKALGARAPI